MSPYYVHYLLTQGDLLNRIIAFNTDFSSKQRELWQQKIKDSGQEQDSLYHLHPELARFHDEHNIAYYFDRPVDRYCLLTPEELDQLIIYLGACVSSQQLSAVTIQAEKDQIYDAIGREVYNFALDYGYLIKNFDYGLNLNALRQDCAYLGLCALKCLNSLFSSHELSEYFINTLIEYTSSRNLDPNIITSNTHVLSYVASPTLTRHAPAAAVMNNPVQYTALDAHPKLDPESRFNMMLQAANNGSGALPAISAGPAAAYQAAYKAGLEADAPQSGSDININTSRQHPSVLTPGMMQAYSESGAQIQNHQLSDGVSEQSATVMTVTNDTTAPDITAAQDAATAPVNLADQNTAANAAAPADEAQSGVQSTPAPVISGTTITDAGTTAAQSAAGNIVTEKVPDQTNGEKGGQAQSTPAAAPAASAPTATSAANDAPTTAPKDDSVSSNAQEAEHQAYQSLDYEQAALYGGYNSKVKRMFKANSIKQQNLHQELANPGPRNTEQLEQQRLVTLEFNPHQVLTLSNLILQHQINECWFEYLNDESLLH